jgi:hypothetical protein
MSGITNAVPIVGSVAGAALVNPKTTDPSQAVLAFTGLALGLYLGIALLLLVAGLTLRFGSRWLARRRSQV